VPLRVTTCHCGTTREQALAATAGPLEPPPPRATGVRGPSIAQAMAAAPNDVKAMAIGAALVLVVGLVWLVVAPSRPVTTPAVLGWVDPGPPPVPRPTPLPQPPFKLPWWK
jgi:hypothetical protein